MKALITPFARVRNSTLVMIAVGTLGLALALWALSPMRLLPGPLEVWDRLNYLLQERGLLVELFTSMRVNLEALAITTVLSLGVCYLFTLPLFRPLTHFLAGVRYWGLAGFLFIFQLLITDSHWVKVVIIVFGMSPYFIASMAEIVDSTSQDEINHARTLKMGPWQTLWEVVIVGKRHHAIETMRQCAAIGWMMVAMTEGLIRNEGGIGVMLVEQNRYMLLGGILAIQFLILAVGLTQDYAIRFVRNATCGYTQTKKGGAK